MFFYRHYLPARFAHFPCKCQHHGVDIYQHLNFEGDYLIGLICLSDVRNVTNWKPSLPSIMFLWILESKKLLQEIKFCSTYFMPFPSTQLSFPEGKLSLDYEKIRSRAFFSPMTLIVTCMLKFWVQYYLFFVVSKIWKFGQVFLFIVLK